MPDVAATIARAYAAMDNRGHFPVHPCKGCGTPLCGADGPRPAETYAGTYTGYCYRCQNLSAYPVADLPDGTVRLSYPPHCPSWRRTREEVWAHPDCPECKGAGRHRVSRSDAFGGSYYVSCKPCLRRVSAVQQDNELDYLGAVRDLLAAANVTGDPVPACKAAAVAAVNRAFEPYADEVPFYRPSKAAATGTIGYGLKPADLKVKRAATLHKRMLATLDREIAQRIAQIAAART